MFDSPSVIILIAAFILDSLLGDPRYPLHPIRIIGWIADLLRKTLFDLKLNGFFSGFILTTLMILLPINVYILLRLALESFHPLAPLVLDVFILYSCIALRDMVRHAKPIAESLEQDNLAEAKEKVRMIVGRDPEKLDKHGLARATVESVAESFVDGFLSPVFWFIIACTLTARFTHFHPVIGGIIATLVYRTTNTLDSMIGYKNEMYRNFGTFAARLDDVLNFIPARISLSVLVPAALILRLNIKTATKTFIQDRKKHASLNSAHTESFVAGALGIRLGGPTEYAHGIVEKPWLGDGTPDVQSSHIYTVCKLITFAGWITVIFCAIVSL